MKNNKNYKTIFSDICVSEKLERNILNMTVNKEKKLRNTHKLAYALSLSLILFVCSTSIVYAKEIKEFIVNITAAMTLEDGTKIKIGNNINFVKIKNNVIKTEEFSPYISMKIDEVENMLGINILKSDKATSNILHYGTGLNKNHSIGRVDLWYPEFIKYSEDKYVSMFISFLNQNADKGYIWAFKEGLDAGGQMKIKNTYHIDNLNVDAIIYTYDWDNDLLNVTFAYNNMLYKITGKSISSTEMLEIINSLN